MADNQHVEDIVKCPECGSRSLTRDETRGEVVCDDYLVLEDNVIDQGAEWRVSSEQGDQRAYGCSAVMLHDRDCHRYRLAKQRLLWKNNQLSTVHNSIRPSGKRDHVFKCYRKKPCNGSS